MCGRVIVDYDEIIGGAADTDLGDWLHAKPEGASSSWNLAPTQDLPVALTSPKDGLKRFETAHWGIIPPWNTDGKPRFTFNARAENLMEKRTFAPSVRQRRCVVPVSGFYEWTGPKGQRRPHAIFGPQPVLPLAGLYAWWKGPAGEWRLTATILTRESAGVMAPLHDRMPVTIGGELMLDWLDPTVEGDQLLVDAVSEASVALSEGLREYEVAPLRGDGPELIRSL